MSVTPAQPDRPVGAVAGFDVSAFRAQFPALRSGIAYFDGPGGTQTPTVVGAAIAGTLTGPLSNRGSAAVSQRNADEAVIAFRSAAADLLNLPPSGIVHGRSATQLTYDFSRHLSRDWGADDAVVVSRLDHDCNVRPWVQAAQRTGAQLRWLDIDPVTADLDPSSIDEQITDGARVVAVTGASNLLGTRPDVARIVERAHAVGALVYLDGVHHAAHSSIDVPALGVDFYVCSPYKFFGPHCALLGASPTLLETVVPDKLLPSTDVVPERFEFGTLPYEQLAGVTACIDFLAGWGTGGTRRQRLESAHAAIAARELYLRERIEGALGELGATVHSVAEHRTPTLLATFPDHSSADVSAALAAKDVLAPAGSFYAYEPAARLGLPDGGVRIGVAAYTSDDDVDRLLDGLRSSL